MGVCVLLFSGLVCFISIVPRSAASILPNAARAPISFCFHGFKPFWHIAGHKQRLYFGLRRLFRQAAKVRPSFLIEDWQCLHGTRSLCEGCTASISLSFLHALPRSTPTHLIGAFHGGGPHELDSAIWQGLVALCSYYNTSQQLHMQLAAHALCIR